MKHHFSLETDSRIVAIQRDRVDSAEIFLIVHHHRICEEKRRRIHIRCTVTSYTSIESLFQEYLVTVQRKSKV